MNVLDAIYQVLVESGESLDTLTITQRIMEKGLWHSESKTPEATIRTMLSVDLHK